LREEREEWRREREESGESAMGPWEQMQEKEKREDDKETRDREGARREEQKIKTKVFPTKTRDIYL